MLSKNYNHKKRGTNISGYSRRKKDLDNDTYLQNFVYQNGTRSRESNNCLCSHLTLRCFHNSQYLQQSLH